MFFCHKCGVQCKVKSQQELSYHLNHHKIEGTLQYPLRCGDPYHICKTTFNKIKHYVRHFVNFHFDCFDLELATVEPLFVEDNQDGPIIHNDYYGDYEPMDAEGNQIQENLPDNNQNVTFSESIDKLKELMRVEALSILISLRSKANVPLNVSVDVMSDLGKFVDLIIDGTAKALKIELEESEKTSNILTNIEKLKGVLPSVNTEYRIRKLYEQHPLFVKPVPLPLSTRHEITLRNEGDGNVVRIVSKENNAYYVPIEKTLRALLHDKDFFDIIFNPDEDDSGNEGVYSSFRTAQRYLQNPAYSDPARKTILLQIYLDGLGITNPLRGASSIHNSGLFYFTILNLPSRFNASLDNVHTLAVCNSLDLKNRDSLHLLFEKIIDDMKALESTGMEIETHRGMVNVYVNLAQVCGDLLALHQMIGFIECFTVDYCCTLCYSTREEMQVYVRESQCHLRSRHEYEEDVEKLDNLPPAKNHFRGVKYPCLLNKLSHFHVVENCTNDPMHTLLEGVIPYVMGALLHSLAQLCPEVNVSSINRRILQLFGSLVVDRYNKPCELNALLQPGEEMSPKQSAAQQWALFRYLPVMLGDCIADTEEAMEYWDLLLLLQEVVDLIFAFRLNDSLLAHLTALVENFLVKFKELYPNLSVRPKMHMLLHFPTIILKNGPVRSYWCMHYERMNGLFKVPSHIMKSFVDPQQTLSNRRQISAFNSILEKRYNRNVIEVGSSTLIPLDEMSQAKNYDIYLSHLSGSDLDVSVCSTIEIKGIKYRKGVLIVLDFDATGYLFGRIELIVCEDLDEPLFFSTCFQTKEFNQLYYCYEIEPQIPCQTILSRLNDLADPLPLDVIKKNGSTFIRMKHHSFPLKK